MNYQTTPGESGNRGPLAHWGPRTNARSARILWGSLACCVNGPLGKRVKNPVWTNPAVRMRHDQRDETRRTLRPPQAQRPPRQTLIRPASVRQEGLSGQNQKGFPDV